MPEGQNTKIVLFGGDSSEAVSTADIVGGIHKISPILLFGTKLGGRSFDLRHGGLHTCSISLSSTVILTGGSDYESIVHNAVDRSMKGNLSLMTLYRRFGFYVNRVSTVACL